MTAHGLNEIQAAVGRKLTGARRYVLGLGISDDAFGHGITELTFDGAQIVIRPGPNEDYLVVEPGPLDSRELNPENWTEVVLFDHGWGPAGRLQHVDVFTDGIEDVALVLEFDSGDRFSVILYKTDVAVGRGLERFEGDPSSAELGLRTRIE